jgi:tRNA 2-thiouridine synthesizing protein A
MVRFARLAERRYLLDVTGYTCPYPVIYTRKAMSKLKPGDILEVLTDNPPSCENVPRAVREDGHEVLGVERVGDGVWKIVIRKRG